MSYRAVSDFERPSEVTDRFWLFAYSRQTDYPAMTDRSGKWLLFVPVGEVDQVWAIVRSAVEDGRLGALAKVATARPSPLAMDQGVKVICVYTYDWTDEPDVMRVREELRRLGFNQKLSYKADQDTISGRYAHTGHRRLSKYRA